jgi:adenylate kinase
MCVTATDTFPVHIDDPASIADCQRRAGMLVQRPDDAPEVIQHRVDIYHETTAPLISYFHQLGMLQRVDGAQSADAVARQIVGHCL